MSIVSETINIVLLKRDVLISWGIYVNWFHCTLCNSMFSDNRLSPFCCILQAAGEQVRRDIMKGELWIKQNWKLFKEKSQDQLKAKMAESSRFKMYRSEFIVHVMLHL